MTSFFNQKNIGNIQLGLRNSTNAINQSSRRLASGQRINSASDDSASLNLASKLQNEARLNSQGIRNISDGVSVTNVASSAVNELIQITSRISELAAQAANGVSSSEQRDTLNTEAQALVSEYGRIALSTSFNNTSLFTENNTIDISFGSDSNEIETLEIGNLLGGTVTTGGGGGGTSEVTEIQYNSGVFVPLPPGPSPSLWLYTDTTNYYFWFSNGSTTDPGEFGTGVAIDISSAVTGIDYANATQAAVNATTGFSATVLGETVTVTNDNPGNVTDGHSLVVTISTITQGSSGGGGGGGSSTTFSDSLDGIDLSSQSSAQTSIDIATSKVNSLSVADAKLGANLRVLNSNYNRYSKNELNLTDAVTKIVSVDVARETTNLIESQIKQQTLTEISKTNNLHSENVLNLLR